MVLLWMFSSCARLNFQTGTLAGSTLEKETHNSSFQFPNKVSDSGSYARRTFWHLIQTKGILMESKDELDDIDAIVQIRQQDKENLLFTLRRGEQILSEQKVRGTWQQGWFISKQKTRMLGIPFLYFVLSERRFRLGATGEGLLEMDVKAGRLGMILVLHAGPVWEEHYQFTKSS